MVTIKNTQVFGIDTALIASGNPMKTGEINTDTYFINNDLSRGIKLGSSPNGMAHDHFLLGIHVQFDILYPQYWTIEAERYHNFEIISSQSKMHKLTLMAKDPESFRGMFNTYVDQSVIDNVSRYVKMYDAEVDEEVKYYYFMKALSNLPMGFELWMTCDLTYLQLKTIYFQRRNHKLKEDWGAFCDWVETLPLFKELVLKEEST